MKYNNLFKNFHKTTFEKYQILNIFLITPQTPDERIAYLDSVSQGFIYMVSSAAVTGNSFGFGEVQQKYFERIHNLQLKNPQIVGFGISDKTSFEQATKYAKGAIIGSAFIKHLSENGTATINDFISKLS